MPLPGAGRTPARHAALAEFGREDLSLARLAEAHTDALAILAEAGRTARPDALYGVWASDGSDSRLRAERLSGGAWRLEGIKQYCSGANLVSDALVSAHAEDGLRLFEVPVDQAAVRALESHWASSAFADTATGPVAFSVIVREQQVLGKPDWYLTRPGFWHGALGPAACWAGGALSLVEAAAALGRRDAHYRAHLGALHALTWGMSAVLERAGREIDADPQDAAGAGRVRALMARHLIERACSEVLDRFGRATGPQLLAFDARAARQHVALNLYLRQCHAERDLEMIPGAV